MNTIDWNAQVKVGRGATDTGAWHRALEVARDLHEAGRWDGSGILVVHDAYDSHRIASYDWLGGLGALEEGKDYEIVQAPGSGDRIPTSRQMPPAGHEVRIDIVSEQVDLAGEEVDLCPRCGEPMGLVAGGGVGCALRTDRWPDRAALVVDAQVAELEELNRNFYYDVFGR